MDAVFLIFVLAGVAVFWGVMTVFSSFFKRVDLFLFEKEQKFFFHKRASKKAIPVRLRRFLNRKKIDYQTIVHPRAFTAAKTAEAEYVSKRSLAKVVMAKAGGADVMLVLPASHTVDLLKLNNALGKLNVRIEDEKEFSYLFPDCEPGTMPPFGSLYHLPYYVDKSLLEGEEIYFNGGTHTLGVKIATRDFKCMTKGHALDFAVVGQKVAA